VGRVPRQVVQTYIDTRFDASAFWLGTLVALLVKVMRIRPAEADGSVVLRLEGNLSGQWVEELRRVTSEPLREPATRLVLDFAEVTFIDADGLALLRELSLRHVILRNGSLFVTQQLKAIEEENPWGA